MNHRSRQLSILPRALRAASLLLLLALSALATAAPVQPAAAPPGPPTSAPPPSIDLTRTLNELGAGQEPVRLITPQAAYVLKLPLSPRESLRAATLTLSTVNSTALIKSRSELSVRLNGQMVAQFALDPTHTVNTRQVALPVEYMQAGYNEVTLSVVQHYTYECEDPLSPELWTEISTLQSSVTMSFAGAKANPNPRLSQLHVAFDRRSWIPRPLSVVAGTEAISEPQLAAASLVVQGLALRLGHRPLKVDVYGASTGASIRAEPTRFPGLSSEVVKGRDALLIGRRAELSRYFDSELYRETAGGPFVGLFPALGGESVILVVTGETDDDLMQAARAIAEPSFLFKDVASQFIQEKWALTPSRVLNATEATAFSEFNYRTTETRGLQTHSSTVEFRAPAEYGAQSGEYATLKLHFSYGGGLREDSSMLIKLNNQFAASVTLSQRTGAELQNYVVKVPAEYVRPGYNSLTFQQVFQPVRDRCEQVREEGLVLTVYEDSTIELPPASVAPVAPDLKRLAQGLWPMQEKMRMYTTRQDPQTAAAVLGFSALIAQRNRGPLEPEVRYSPFEQGHMLVIGPGDGIAEFVKQALPLRRYDWTAAGEQAGLLQTVEGKRVITAFVAKDSSVLRNAISVLSEKGLWNGLSGEAAVIDVAEQTLVTHPATTTVTFGKVSRITNRLAIGSWEDLTILAGGLSLVFAFAFIAVLRRRAETREKLSTSDVYKPVLQVPGPGFQ